MPNTLDLLEISKMALKEKVIAALVDLLQKNVEDAEIQDQLMPLIPAAVNLGVDEGIPAMMEVLEGLTKSDPYESMARLIGAATPEQRRTIMEHYRAEAIQEIADRARREESTWQLIKSGLSVVVSILLSLL